MPTYEYKCNDCEERLDVNQKINDEPLTKCPKCGNETFIRLISKSSFILKGDGWYGKGS